MKYVVGVGASGALAHERVADGVARLRSLPPSLARVVATSRVYANPAFGGVTHQRFVNAAVVVESALAAPALLHALHAIERDVGRVRGVKNAARALDLDVLWCVEAVGPLRSPTLVVPHPSFANRPSAIVPAVEAMERAGLAVPAPIRMARDGADRGTLTALDFDGNHAVHPFSSSSPRW